MREIKFRAWDREEDEYIPWEKLIRTRYNQDYIQDHDDPKGPILSVLTDKHILLEQFTGLHDKNGREIYEGDILDVWYPDSPMNQHHREPVIYREDSACFDTHYVEDWLRLECTVIGNIHENPELLEAPHA